MSRESERRRAAALKAADARDLIRAKFPNVLSQMAPWQVDQVQRVLDSYVVNPAVQKEAADIEFVASRDMEFDPSGKMVFKDRKATARIQAAKADFITVKEEHKHVRLDYGKLLAPDALKPSTDNPDEAEFLLDINETLVSRGVWLAFQMGSSEDEPGRAYTRHFDARTLDCWLELGYNGEVIKGALAAGGRLTREAILGTTSLGAGYYKAVWHGPVRTALERETNRLLRNIEAGRQQHFELAKIRHVSFPGTVWVADKLGGADFPDKSNWELPRTLVMQAMHLSAQGNVRGAQAYLVVAAIMTRNAARLLSNYIGDFSSGAERSAKVLTVVKIASEVTFAVLGTAGAVRTVVSVAATAGVRAASAASVDAVAEKFVGDYVAKNPGVAKDLASVRWVAGPRGSVSRAVSPMTGSISWP